MAVSVYPDSDAIADAMIARGLTPEDEGYRAAVESLLREVVKSVNRSLPAYKHVGRLIVRKAPFVKTTTQKIRRNADENTVAGREREDSV